MPQRGQLELSCVLDFGLFCMPVTLMLDLTEVDLTEDERWSWIRQFGYPIGVPQRQVSTLSIRVHSFAFARLVQEAGTWERLTWGDWLEVNGREPELGRGWYFVVNYHAASGDAPLGAFCFDAVAVLTNLAHISRSVQLGREDGGLSAGDVELEGDVVQVFLEFARKGDREQFVELAKCYGIVDPAVQEEFWAGTRRRVRKKRK